MTRWIQGLEAGVNDTYIDSEVDVPARIRARSPSRPSASNEETRRLQGQPEYLLNVCLNYDHDEWAPRPACSTTSGETLPTGAATGLNNSTPNVFERSFGVLDLTASKIPRT